MYISKPKISPTNDKQLASKPSVPLHRGKGNDTTVSVADESVRHPVTQRYVARVKRV